MPLSAEQEASLKARTGANVLYIKEDKAIYYAPKRMTFMEKAQSENNNMVDLYVASQKFKEDFPGEKVNIVRL